MSIRPKDATPGGPVETGQVTSKRFWILRRLSDHPLAVLGFIFLAFLVIVSALAPFLTPYDPTSQDLFGRLDPPSQAHWFGRDEAGRDVLTRTLYGGRYSLFIGISASAIGIVFGLVLGTLGGFWGGWLDLVLMRFIDLMLSFPGVLLAILIVSVLGPGLNNLIIALAIWRTPTIARIIRGNILSLKEQDFVEAAWAQGAETTRVIVRHLLPNSISPIIVYGTLSVADSLITAASLSFLGLGVQPPTAEWGAMIGAGREYIVEAPYLTYFPGICIFLTVLSLNFVGDALRDVLDPRLRTNVGE